jgi:hypothetical protein
VTLLGAAVAGLLIWIATQLNHAHEGGYWGIVGLMAGAGLVMALSQLLGGWTKWGLPRLSPIVLLVAFVPVAIAALWVIFAGEPHAGWFHNHVMAWTRDIHISGLVTDMLTYIPVLAFGAGLVFGFSFDTTGPRVRETAVDRRRGAVAPADRRAADEPLTADRGATTRSTRRAREREPVTSDGRYVDDNAPTRTGDGRYVDENAPTRSGGGRYVDENANAPTTGDGRYVDDNAPTRTGDGRYVDENANAPTTGDGRYVDENAPTRTTERS